MPAPSSTIEVTKPTSTLPAGPIVLSWYARKNATPRTSRMMPSLLSQSVPSISSMSSDDLNRSIIEAPASVAARIGADGDAGESAGGLGGVGTRGAAGGGTADGGSGTFRLAHSSATASEEGFETAGSASGAWNGAAGGGMSLPVSQVVERPAPFPGLAVPLSPARARECDL